MQTIIEKLIHIRETPRRMREDYLKKMGLLDYLASEDTPEISHFKFKEKLDYLIAGKPNLRCYCGSLLKIGYQYCSPQCVGRSPAVKIKLSETQRNNKVERYAKTKATMLSRYGVEHNNELESCKISRKMKQLLYIEKVNAKTFSNVGLDIYNYQDKESLQKMIDSCLSLETLRDTHFSGLDLMSMCRHLNKFGVKMYPKSTSGGEREIADYIKSLGMEILTSDRTIIKPYELDIVIPSKKIAIEHDGIYFHSDLMVKENSYHLKKTELAEKQGYQLLHIFENEWLSNKELCKSILSSKLGLYKNKVFARQCIAEFISSKEADSFFKRTHIQQNSPTQFYIGLKKDGILLSCMSFGKPRFSKESDFELIRYSTELYTQIVGGFGKMLNFFRNHHNGTILTYCDRRFSKGDMYSKFGRLIRITNPGYHWCHLYKIENLSRYQTQKKNLKRLFPDVYEVDKTEAEIMSKSGYFRLYDCGHKVYILSS